MFSATRTRTMGAALRSRPRLNWIQNPVSCLHVCEFRTFKGALYITHLAHLLPASFNHTLDPAVLRTLVGSEFCVASLLTNLWSLNSQLAASTTTAQGLFCFPTYLSSQPQAQLQ